MRATLFLYTPFENDARVLRQATALAEAGYEVRLLATARPGIPSRERMDRFEVTRLESEPPTARLVRRVIASRGAGSGVPGTVVDAGRLSGPEAGGVGPGATRLALGLHLTLIWLRYRRQALDAAAAAPADLWIANDLDTLPVAVSARERLGGAVLYDSHELYVERGVRTRITRRVQAAFERRGIRSADAAVTVNESIAAELSRRYGVPRPTVVMNVPARSPDPEQAPRVSGLRGRAGVPDSAPVGLYLGGMSPGRGLEEMVKAAALVEGLVLVLVGPVAPAFRARLEDLAQGVGCADRLRLLDPVPENQVVALAAGADVGLVPYRNTSLNNYLSLPNKLFEYLAAGVPVVASDFPELRRVVTGREAGVVCDPDSPDDIARAVREVLADSGALAAGALAAGRELTWDHERPKLLGVADRLTTGRE